MKKIRFLMLLLALINSRLWAQHPDLNYSPYRMVFEDQFNYLCEAGAPYAYQADPVFNTNWELKDDWFGPGEATIYRPDHVLMRNCGIMTFTEHTIPLSSLTNSHGVTRNVNHIGGFMATKAPFRFGYGIIEASIKLTADVAQIPYNDSDPAPAECAFWTSGGYTEIDIVDIANSNRIYGGVGDWTSPNNAKVIGPLYPNYLGTISNLSTSFHKYSCVWTPEKVEFYLDNKFLYEVDYVDVRTYPLKDNIIELATILQKTCTGNDFFMDLDWVRVWEQKCDGSSFVLTAPSNGDPLVYGYPELSAGLFKKKDIQINVHGFPAPLFDDPVSARQNEATILEAESVIIGPDFVADQSTLIKGDPARPDRITNGFFEIHPNTCAQSKSSETSGSDVVNIVGQADVSEIWGAHREEQRQGTQVEEGTQKLNEEISMNGQKSEKGLPQSIVKSVKVDIYPNPAKEKATVNIELPISSKVKLTLTNAEGQEFNQRIEPFEPQQSEGKRSIVINTAQLAPGIYYVRIQVGNELLVKKLTVL